MPVIFPPQMYDARRAAADVLRILTIDSGDPMGWAVFQERELQCAGSCALENFPLDPSYGIGLVVFELPNYRARGGIDDIAKCAARGGLAAGHVHAPWCWITPMQWKGQVPKNIMVQRVKDQIDPEEQKKVYGRATHVYDAIGMGLWLRKRI